MTAYLQNGTVETIPWFGNARYLRIGVMHCVGFARPQSPKRIPAPLTLQKPLKH